MSRMGKENDDFRLSVSQSVPPISQKNASKDFSSFLHMNLRFVGVTK